MGSSFLANLDPPSTMFHTSRRKKHSPWVVLNHFFVQCKGPSPLVMPNRNNIISKGVIAYGSVATKDIDLDCTTPPQANWPNGLLAHPSPALIQSSHAQTTYLRFLKKDLRFQWKRKRRHLLVVSVKMHGQLPIRRRKWCETSIHLRLTWSNVPYAHLFVAILS